MTVQTQRVVVAQDGKDIPSATALPAGGWGIRGWLSAIYTKLSASVAVSGPLTDTQLRATAVPIQLGSENLSPFNDLISVTLTPLVQVDFVYGINSQQGAVAIVTTGVGDTSTGRLRLQTGTGAAGSAIYTSRRSAQYRPGQGLVWRGTSPFTAGVANSIQLAGAGSATDGYFFGFNGTAFGIAHRNNSATPTWVAQTVWNGDKCDGAGASAFNWVDKTKGVPLQIMYPYLGYGNITFWVQDPLTSRWILCHTIRYANSSTSTQIRVPDLYIRYEATNTGNTTNLIVYGGSAAIFICGSYSLLAMPKWAADSNKAAITTETVLLSIRNATVYNTVTNQGLIRINSVSFSSTANNGVAILRFKVGATVGGTPAFATINGTTADNGVSITAGNSLASIDTAGTTVTGGTYIFNMTIGSPGNDTIDVQDLGIFVAPGETLTISGFSTASTTLGVGVNWTEDS